MVDVIPSRRPHAGSSGQWPVVSDQSVQGSLAIERWRYGCEISTNSGRGADSPLGGRPSGLKLTTREGLVGTAEAVPYPKRMYTQPPCTESNLHRAESTSSQIYIEPNLYLTESGLSQAWGRQTSVLFCHGSGYVNDRQQHEDVGLQNRNHYVKPTEDNWNADRDHGKEHQANQIASKNIRPETYSKR